MRCGAPRRRCSGASPASGSSSTGCARGPGSSTTLAGLDEYVRVEGVDLGAANIAGVNVPVLAGVRLAPPAVDYFATPAWLDDAVAVLGELVRLRAEAVVFGRQRDLLGEELRLTSQRVNLFEKVMIPRTLDNIRVIRIALGDAQTAAVSRAKLAKSKTVSVLSGKSSA